MLRDRAGGVIVRAALKRLVESPAFTDLMAASQVGAGHTNQRAPGDAAQIYRLLKGLETTLQSLDTGSKRRRSADERTRRNYMTTASGSAPRQSAAPGVTGHGQP